VSINEDENTGLWTPLVVDIEYISSKVKQPRLAVLACLWQSFRTCDF